MGNFFFRLSVKGQINLLLKVMALAIVLFSGTLIYERWSTYVENKSLSVLIDFSVKSSELLHEVQKERGLTAGFTKSGGTKFVSELPMQRKNVDEKKEALISFLEETHISELDEFFGASIDKVISNIEKMSGVRRKVDSLSIKPANAIGFYTSLNKSLLDGIGNTQKYSKDPKIIRDLSAYVNFLQGKERAGIERAVGAGGFGTKFSESDIVKFNKLITIQDVYYSVFKAIATEDHVALFENKMGNEAVADVDRMRQIARKSVHTGYSEGVSASDWFGTITKKINILKSIEDELSKDLYGVIEGEKNAALKFFILLLLITALILIPVFYLSKMFSEELVKCFDNLKLLLENGKRGDFLGRVVPITAQGEFKEVQVGLNAFMNQVEVFTREVSSSMVAVSRGEYYRKIQVKGFQGDFLSSANTINASSAVAEKGAGELSEIFVELEESVKLVVEETFDIAENMKDSSNNMLSLSSGSEEKSKAVEASATTAQESTNSVASAVEELMASIAEISSQASMASQVVFDAEKEVGVISDTAESFGVEVEKVSEILDLIKDIADQINLLALNATIEAARAGDAGKGFAVVASEVKNLANQTAKATETITEQIEAIQTGSVEIINGISSIGGTMTKVAEISTAISGAIEEQGAVTREISVNMQKTSSNASEVQNNIVAIRSSLEETSSSASGVLSMTENLSDNIMKLDASLETVINSRK